MTREKVALLFMLIVIVSSPALSSDASSRMTAGIGPGYYYLSPKDAQLQDFYRGGLTWQAHLGIKASTGLSAVLDIGYYSEDNRSPLAPYGTRLSIIPVTASLSYAPFKDSAVSPYFGGGVGIYNINESDPDFNYLKATKFGKHIFAGTDLYLSPDTVIRGELRQVFIDPVSSPLYFEANFGGFLATVMLSTEWPLFKAEPPMTPEERTLYLQQKAYEAEIRARERELRLMEDYYRRREWDRMAYERWRTRDILLIEINRTKEDIEAEKAKAEQIRIEREQKRQQYLQEKQQLREQQKESVINN